MSVCSAHVLCYAAWLLGIVLMYFRYRPSVHL